MGSRIQFITILLGVIGIAIHVGGRKHQHKEELDHVLGNTNSTDILCHPDSPRLLSRFLIQRYADARYELGMASSISEYYIKRNFTYYDNMDFILVKFFSFSPDAILFLTLNGVIIPYVRLFKCANEGISSNLYRLTVAKPTVHFKTIRINAKSQSQYQFILSALQHLNNYNQTSLAPSFTFVREPLQRFMSGFAETVYKHFTKFKIINSFDGSPLKINSSLAKEYMIRMLNLEDPLHDIEHIYPMSGAFFQYEIPVVGFVETLKHDWESKIKPLYKINESYNPNLGLHATSVFHPLTLEKKLQSSRDPNNARAAIKHLFMNDRSFARAFCHLLLIDYICLPMYTLPETCAFLNTTRIVAMDFIRRGRVVPPMPIH